MPDDEASSRPDPTTTGGGHGPARRPTGVTGSAGVRDGRSTRWDGYRARRRRLLIEAGLAVLNDVGPEFGIDQVAERAGVTKPVIYRQFSDRAGLIDAIGEHFFETLAQEQLAPAIRSDESLKDRTKLIVRAFVDFVDEYPLAYRSLVALDSVHSRSAFRLARDAVAEVLIDLLADASNSAGSDRAAAELWVQGMIGCVLNGSDWWLDHRSIGVPRLVDDLTELVWDLVGGFARRHGVHLDLDARVGVTGSPRHVIRRP